MSVFLCARNTCAPAGSGDKGGAKMGEAVYKGHWSYELMLNLQLGIRYSVSRITPEPTPKELNASHFELKVCVAGCGPHFAAHCWGWGWGWAWGCLVHACLLPAHAAVASSLSHKPRDTKHIVLCLTIQHGSSR
jgi:hypothetical protein